MKRTHTLLALFFVLLVISSSCKRSKKKILLGKWQGVEMRTKNLKLTKEDLKWMTVEFLPDGRMLNSTQNSDSIVKGTYKLKDEWIISTIDTLTDSARIKEISDKKIVLSISDRRNRNDQIEMDFEKLD